jgi:hypothetical protein
VRGSGFARVAAVGASLAVVLVSAPAGSATAASTTPTASFVLDAVQLAVSAGVLSELGSFDAAPAGSALQSASATSQGPYREITVEALPFGTESGADPVLGVVASGGAASARETLQQYRDSQNGLSLPPVTATLFGSQVAGAANLVDLQVDGPTASPVTVIEWVTQAGPRLWLVRASQQLSDSSTASRTAAETEFSDISVSASNPSAPTTVGTEQSGGGSSGTGTVEAPAAVASPIDTAAVPFPSWWSGDCDTNNYQAKAGQPAYLLSAGAVWDGLEACGPRPGYNEGPDEGVRFTGAQWGVLEWECVELSMRWMYLAWDVEPYPANGKGVVWNYATFEGTYNPSGPTLVATANNGSGALPQPGDVLSYGTTSTFGHTSVVTGVDVDANGNGNISVMEENASATGWDTVPVSDWVLGGFDGGVSGWLHDPGFSVTQPRSSTPSRLLDTRTSQQTLGRNSSLNLTVTGVDGVPTTAAAVALNVTVTDTTAASYLAVYPAGGAQPVVSNLNWVRGETVPNSVIVPIGTGGQVTIYNHTGSTDVVVDLEGYFAPESGASTAGAYVPLTPARITDTRAGSGDPNAGDTLGAGSSLNVQVTGEGGVPAGATGAILNVTVTDTMGASFLTVYPGGTMPTASNLNWTAGEIVANRVLAPLSSTGSITVYNHTGSADVVVDVDGYFTNGTATPPSSASFYTPTTPARIIDTRAGSGYPNAGDTLGANSTLPVDVIGEGGIPASATAAVLNVTAANTTAASFFTVYPGGTMPTASDVNWGTGQVVPNLTVATLTSMGSISIYNHAGSADVIVDAFGYFAESTAPTAPGAPTTLTATAGSGEVGLVWAAPFSDGGSVITSFNVYPRSTDQVGPLTHEQATYPTGTMDLLKANVSAGGHLSSASLSHAAAPRRRFR